MDPPETYGDGRETIGKQTCRHFKERPFILLR